MANMNEQHDEVVQLRNKETVLEALSRAGLLPDASAHVDVSIIVRPQLRSTSE